MPDAFFQYPTTLHLCSSPTLDLRLNKVMSDDHRAAFLSGEVIVEEKMDGANLGISFNHQGELILQNRGSILKPPMVGQWRLLMEWIEPKMEVMLDVVGDRYLLFGEWCFALHSVFYDRLPDWFLGFDVYDKADQRFLLKDARDLLFSRLALHSVPFLEKGRFDLQTIRRFLGVSKHGSQLAEGIVLRQEVDGKLLDRAKLVRDSFVQSIEEHWSRKPLRRNELASWNKNSTMDDA